MCIEVINRLGHSVRIWRVDWVDQVGVGGDSVSGVVSCTRNGCDFDGVLDGVTFLDRTRNLSGGWCQYTQ